MLNFVPIVGNERTIVSTAGVYASKIGNRRRRRPRSFDERRVCAKPDCGTVISKYNAADHCFTHAAPQFKRLRGVVSDDR